MAIRMYFNKYNRYNSNKWVWQPYIYAHNCSLEEQREWNDLYLRCRGRRNGKDKVILDFTSIEKDADHNASGLGVALLLAQGAVIPAQETAYLIAVVSGQVHTGFAAKAVGSKIFPHVILLMIPRRAKAHGPAAAKGCILLFVSECSPRFCAAFRCISPPPQPGACMALF